MDIIRYITLAVTMNSSTTSQGYGIQFTVVRWGQSHWYSTDRRIEQESRPRSGSPRPSGIDNFLPRGTHDVWPVPSTASIRPIRRYIDVPLSRAANGRVTAKEAGDNPRSLLIISGWREKPNRKGHLTDRQAGINMYVCTRILLVLLPKRWR